MRQWITVMILTCALALLGILWLNGRNENLEDLARAGGTQRSAPIQASAQIVINAPAEKVWRVLTDVNGWPRWQSSIESAAISGAVERGSTFLWSTGGAHINSKIALVEPETRIAWTGSAMNAQAVHVWRLVRLPGNKTRVETDESMSGILLTLFYSSRQLQESDQLWLERLKQEAER
jgi:uncharacterized membrane protein